MHCRRAPVLMVIAVVLPHVLRKVRSEHLPAYGGILWLFYFVYDKYIIYKIKKKDKDKGSDLFSSNLTKTRRSFIKFDPYDFVCALIHLRLMITYLVNHYVVDLSGQLFVYIGYSLHMDFSKFEFADYQLGVKS
ncbi:hypothetical protein MG293_020515 [Ovis ammon polii]|uniref:Uncharacterized protein n=1 Tax=Ovis ammon polii TaxID=230172 RepID=A0AAD4TMN6_OVIAM|nr:hypothetical protein MG293_020515 [Ovis ammon polii]